MFLAEVLETQRGLASVFAIVPPVLQPPSVSDGVPDAAMGEELAIVVYPQPGSDLTEDLLRAYLKQRLGGYKVPRYIQIVDQPLPQNASGKLFKRKIQDEFITRIA